MVFHIYPAGHGFNCDQRSAFNAECAALARPSHAGFPGRARRLTRNPQGKNAHISRLPAYQDQAPYKLGVLLVNSGTPDSLTSGGVRRFLRRLLRDRRTIEVSRAIWCWILYFIILPLRPARVIPKYRRVWTDAGSPLLVHSQLLRSTLEKTLSARAGTAVAVELGMLYSTPGVAAGLDALRARGGQRIVVLPLFPQYSGTTTGAACDQVGLALRCWRFLPELRFVNDYTWTVAISRRWPQASSRTARPVRGGTPAVLLSWHTGELLAGGDPYMRKCHATAAAIAQQRFCPVRPGA